MKYQVIIASAFISLLSGTAALAADVPESKLYAQFSLGSGVSGSSKLTISESGVGSDSASEDLKAGIFVAAAIGKPLAHGFSIEAEGLYLHNKIKSDDLDAALGAPLGLSITSWGALANIQYAVAPIGPATFHVGAGVGLGQTRYDLMGSSEEKSGAIWQLMAGISYPVSDKLSWDAGYRYLNVPKVSLSETSGGVTDTAKIESHAHVLSIGLRAKF